MPVVPTPFANGTVITATAVRTELDKVRDWANAIPVADVQTDSISKQNVALPVAAGFPKENLEGQQQHLAERIIGANDPGVKPSLDASIVGSLTADMTSSHRTVFLSELLEGDKFRLVFKRVELFELSDVEVTCSLFAGTTNDSGAAPDSNAGLLRIQYQLVGTTGTGITVPGTARRMNPSTTRGIGGVDQLEHSYYDFVGMVEDLAAGTYDFWVEYRRDGAPTGLGQVTIMMPTLVIEVHEQG